MVEGGFNQFYLPVLLVKVYLSYQEQSVKACFCNLIPIYIRGESLASESILINVELFISKLILSNFLGLKML